MDSPVLLFALALAIVSVTQCEALYDGTRTGNYYRETSGTNCARITTKADCEAAAGGLTATEETASGWPPYCYFYHGHLFFNKYTNGNTGRLAQPCRADTMECLCEEVVYGDYEATFNLAGRSDEIKNEERAGRMKKQVRSRKTKNEE